MSAAERTIPGGFLAALEEQEREDLQLRGQRRRFRPGGALFNEGERSDRVVVLVSGQVKVSYYTDDGREVMLAVRGPGDLLGDLSVLDGEPVSASVTALEPVEALALTADQFKAYVQTHPRVALVLLEMLSKRLRDADRKRIEFAAYDSVGRVARRLVELAERFGEAAGETLKINVPLSQQELAGWVGASREAVSKALHILRRRGWIETARRGITVLDLEALRRRAD